MLVFVLKHSISRVLGGVVKAVDSGLDGKNILTISEALIFRAVENAVAWELSCQDAPAVARVVVDYSHGSS
jgi:hypothetical protein